jgi:hypothetical protein
VVEVNVLHEPLNGQVFLSRLHESQVDGVQVLQTTHRRNELVSWLDCCRVIGSDSQGQPPLLALWVNGVGEVEVSVHLTEHIQRYSGLRCESLNEDDFEVGVIVEEALEVSRRRLTAKLNVLFSEVLRFIGLLGREVELHGRQAWLVDPGIPVDCTEDSVGFSLVEVSFDIIFPVEPEFISDHRGLGMGIDVGSEEVLEFGLSYQALEKVE